MRSIINTLGFFFILPYIICGQNEKIDSLINLTAEHKEDTSKVNTLLELARAFSSTSLDSSRVYSLEAQNLARKLDYRKGEGDAYRNLTFIYSNKAQYDSAQYYINLAKPIYEKLGDISREIKLKSLEANLLEKEGDYSASQSLYYEILRICEEKDFYLDQVDILNALAVQSLGQRDVEGSINLLNQSLRISEQHNYTNKVIRACINLSIAHDSIEIRQVYLQRAIDLAEPLLLNRELSYAYAAKATIEYSLENYEEAIILYHKSIGIARQTGDKLKELRIAKSIGEAFLAAEKPDSAVYYLKRFIASDLEDFRTSKYISLKSLSEALAMKAEYHEAYDTLTRSYELAQEVYNQNIADNMAEADTKYETEKKDAELARQDLALEKGENQRNQLIAGSLILLVLLSGTYLWYYERQKRKKKEAELALINKQKEAEKLKELDVLKNAFFTNVSHELRTPLTLILGPLSDLLEKIEESDIKKSVHLAHSNAERLLDMINEVMDLSKLESGQVQLISNEINLQLFIKRVVYAFESMAEMRNIQLEMKTNVASVVIRIDDKKLEKIINNLISNAIKFSPNDSKVSIQVGLYDGAFSFAVSDKGKGIHPDETEKIFNRFYQSNIITAVEGGGTGVGLALSRELTELLGGELRVESKLGEGSVFTLIMPMEEIGVEINNKVTLEQTVDKKATYSPILINGEKPNILVVEDNDEMRQYLGSILEDEYRLSFAEDGYIALQLLQKNSFDIISSDIMMPHMDGFELKTKVNQLPGLKRTPFIFLSARTLEADKLQGLQLGVDDYITKPFNKQEYRARINNLLRNKIERDAWISGSDFGEIKSTNIDEDILKQAEISILKNIANPEYKVNRLAADLNYSQRQLTRLLKKLTGMAPVNFILELRLQRAYNLLKARKFTTINEVRYEVGVESASYFTRKFKERYGISPGVLLE